ncbi:hypothetical protein GCM10027614_84820 [Micromonospora vulcania]
MKIQDYTVRALREAIGYVPQDQFLFSTTVRDNIRFGKPDAPQEEVTKIAKLVSVDEDILGFENGYDTIVGERGVSPLVVRSSSCHRTCTNYEPRIAYFR